MTYLPIPFIIKKTTQEVGLFRLLYKFVENGEYPYWFVKYLS